MNESIHVFDRIRYIFYQLGKKSMQSNSTFNRITVIKRFTNLLPSNLRSVRVQWLTVHSVSCLLVTTDKRSLVKIMGKVVAIAAGATRPAIRSPSLAEIDFRPSVKMLGFFNVLRLRPLQPIKALDETASVVQESAVISGIAFPFIFLSQKLDIKKISYLFLCSFY